MELATPDAFFDILRFQQVTGIAVLKTQEKVWGGLLDMVSTQTAWLVPLTQKPQETAQEAAAEVKEAVADVQEEAAASLQEAATVIDESAGAVLAVADVAEEPITPPEAPLAAPAPALLKTRRVKKS